MLKVSLYLALASTLLLVALPVVAQPSTAQKATAEAYFDDGVRLMRSGNFAEACPKLETSQRIDPAVGTLLYLGECYEKLGKTASAWVTFREADALARSANQPQRAELAKVHAERLQQNLSRLTIELADETLRLPGLQLRCGAVPLDVSAPTLTVPVDPGEVVIQASAPGYTSLSRAVTVGPGGRVSVNIPPLVRDPNATPPPAPGSSPATTTNVPPAAPPQSASPAGSEKAVPRTTATHRSLAWPIALGAVGLVGLGVGSVFGVKAIHDASTAGDLCPNRRCTEQRGETLMTDARHEANVSNVAFGVGAAGVAAAIIVYVLEGPRPEEGTLHLVPAVSVTGASFAFEGRL